MSMPELSGLGYADETLQGKDAYGLQKVVASMSAQEFLDGLTSDEFLMVRLPTTFLESSIIGNFNHCGIAANSKEIKMTCSGREELKLWCLFSNLPEFRHFSMTRIVEHMALIERFSTCRSTVWDTSAICPAHADTSANLSIKLDPDTGNVKMECDKGCSIKAICDSVGILPGRLQNSEAPVMHAVPLETIKRFERQIKRGLNSWQNLLQRNGIPPRGDELSRLAEILELDEETLVAMEVCWLAEYNAHAFPERNGHGEICGILLRFKDGRMFSCEDAGRGLTLPLGWRERPGPVYICYGLLDTAAATRMGYRAIGRPLIGNVMPDLVTLLSTVPGDIVVIACQNKQQQLSDSTELAAELERHLARSITVHQLPDNFADLRTFFNKFRREMQAKQLAEDEALAEMDDECEIDESDDLDDFDEFDDED